MPTYEYECDKCGYFEREQRITDAPLERCDTCHRKVHRLIPGGTSFIKGRPTRKVPGPAQETCRSEGGACEGCPRKSDPAFA